MNGSLATIVFAVSVTNVAATGFVGYRLRHISPSTTNSTSNNNVDSSNSAYAEESDVETLAQSEMPRGTEHAEDAAAPEGTDAHAAGRDDLDLAEERLALFEIAREHEERVENLMKRTWRAQEGSDAGGIARPLGRAARAARADRTRLTDRTDGTDASARANLSPLNNLALADDNEDEWDPLAEADLPGSAQNDAKAPEVSDVADSEPRDKHVTSPLAMGTIRTRGAGDVSSGRKRETSVRAPSDADVPAADGDVSRKQLLRLIKGHIPSFRDCYERILKEHEGLEGKMRLTIDVMPSGRGSPVRIESDSVGNEDLRACIVRRSTYWRFPKPFRPVSLAFSVVFTPTL